MNGGADEFRRARRAHIRREGATTSRRAAADPVATLHAIIARMEPGPGATELRSVADGISERIARADAAAAERRVEFVATVREEAARILARDSPDPRDTAPRARPSK